MPINMTAQRLENLNNKFTAYFDGVDTARENAIKLGREISKRSSAIMRKLHSQNQKRLDELIKELENVKEQYIGYKEGLKKYPEIYYSNMVENFIQEYVETTIMLTLIKNDFKLTKLPDPDKMGVRYSTYLLGLSDVIGELRRFTLDAIRCQKLTDAVLYLETMEQVFDIIIDLNYPDGVLPLRRKQDIARALIEKTRSELVFATSEYSLKENISDLKVELKKYNKKLLR